MSIFNITWPPGVQSAMQAALDQVQNLESRDCILYFPGTPQPVNNNQSFTPPVGTDISNNVWAGGSPLPFNNIQNNVYEDANSFASVETTGTVRLVIYPNPTKFNDIFPIGERKEEGIILTRGYLTDLEKVLNAVRMETFIEAGTNHYKYKLDSEPIFMGSLVPTRYWYALWTRL